MKKIFILLLFFINNIANAQYPSDFTIESLKNEYIKSIECKNICGIFTGLTIKNIDINKQQINFELPISSTQLTTVKLPFLENSLNWNSFYLNGKKINSISSNNNNIFVAIPKGNHILEIKTTIKNGQFKIKLAEDPKNFENNSKINAEIKNIGEDFFLDIQNTENVNIIKKSEIFTSISEQPLYSITRELFISDKWKIKTTVTPLMLVENKSTNILVPMIEGENILNNSFEVINKKVNLTLSNNSISWESSINPIKNLTFKNSDYSNLEIWKIYNENNWIYSFNGEAPIESIGNNKYKTINTWIMWPNEKVELTFTLPQILQGQKTNVVDFKLNTILSKNEMIYESSFIINSSIGGRYIIEFDNKNSEIVDLMVSNSKSENKIKDGKLALDLFAGQNQINMSFKSNDINYFYKTPIIKFETPITNASFNIEIKDRWTIFAGGGNIRPAILLWGIVFSFMLFAYFLNKTKVTPLGLSSWLLLLIGLSQSFFITTLIVIGFLLSFGYKDKIVNLKRNSEGEISFKDYNRIQTILATLAILGIITLISVVGKGLIENPEIFVYGINSNKSSLFWYIQSWNGVDKNPWILSVPLDIYRILILSWGVWLAFSLISWIKWMWVVYSKDGYWKQFEAKETTTVNPIIYNQNSLNLDKENK